MKKNKIHQAHGALCCEGKSVLDCVSKSSNASVSKKLENMSLEELQVYAEDLDLVPEDNKTSLIKTIQKALKRK